MDMKGLIRILAFIEAALGQATFITLALRVKLEQRGQR